MCECFDCFCLVWSLSNLYFLSWSTLSPELYEMCCINNLDSFSPHEGDVKSSHTSSSSSSSSSSSPCRDAPPQDCVHTGHRGLRPALAGPTPPAHYRQWPLCQLLLPWQPGGLPLWRTRLATVARWVCMLVVCVCVCVCVSADVSQLG